MKPESILEARNLSKAYGALLAVDDVSLAVQPNSFHSIIGPNGAGKTTLFNLLTGTVHPTSGQVFFKGKEITRVPMHQIARLGIGRSFQITNIFPNLNVLENIRLGCQAMGGDNFRLFRHYKSFPQYEARAWQVIDLVGLNERANLPARALPHGDQRKLELGMILAPDPELLLLDEPTAGMAAEQVPELIDLIKSIRDQGQKTVMLVEHNMNVVMSVSDTITVMHQGKLLAEGKPAEIAANQAVQSAYLGSLYGDLDQMIS